MKRAETPDVVPPGAHRALTALLLVLAVSLAVSALLGDSATFDEAFHLPAGIIQLRTGDVRFAPDHPPLARLWAALPSLLQPVALPDPASPAWQSGEFLTAGREFLFVRNAPEPLLTRARFMVVALLVALLGLVAYAARRLFGADAGLLALATAALSPALLAHGHLVTTDLPAALAAFGTLLAFAAFAARPGPLRLAGAAAAFAALVLTKNSWPAIVPALVVMGLVSIFGRETPRAARPARRAAWAAAAALSALAAWGGLWAGYGLRYSPFRGPGAETARMHLPARPGVAPPSGQEAAWDEVLSDARGRPRSGAVPAFVRAARARRAFPEAWLYGLALIGKMSPRIAYFEGMFGSGWPAYFPVAFLVKTPSPTLLLAALGIVAVAVGRARPRDRVLAAGLAAYALSYAAAAIGSGMNIGHRHLLPIEPVLAVAAGAAAAWMAARRGRAAVAGLVLWLAASVLVAHPGELGYFNEVAGGFRRGWSTLADSNVDWGQDLGRLAEWTRANGSPVIRLAYFGVADPRSAGLNAVDAGSLLAFGPRLLPEPGVYAVSVNQMLGLFGAQARDAFWERPGTRAWYAGQRLAVRRGTLSEGSPGWDAFVAAARGRVLHGLKRLDPDVYVGTSIRVYRLSEIELEALLAP